MSKLIRYRKPSKTPAKVQTYLRKVEKHIGLSSAKMVDGTLCFVANSPMGSEEADRLARAMSCGWLLTGSESEADHPAVRAAFRLERYAVLVIFFRGAVPAV